MDISQYNFLVKLIQDVFNRLKKKGTMVAINYDHWLINITSSQLSRSGNYYC